MNSNCLDGLQCPKCGSEEPFIMTGLAVFTIWDDGIHDYNNVSWDDSSDCFCVECNYSETVAAFRRKP